MKKLLAFCLILATCFSLFSLQVAAAGEYRTWLQSDSRWGSIKFGTTDTISKSGCALTSIAKLMVHSGAVADNEAVFNPGIFCNWLKNNGGLTSQGWIVWSKAGEYTSKFTYEGEALLSGTKAQKAATIASYLNDGCVAVAMVKGGGHYVAVDKVVGSTVYIMDPANTGYTNLFDYEASGVEKIRIYKGPHNGVGSTVAYDTEIDPVGTKYTITSDNGVNLRAGAGTSHEVLTAIPYNVTVTVTKTQNGWGYTTYDGKKGWFSLEFAKGSVTLRGLQVTPPTKTKYTVGESLDTKGMTVTALYSDGSSKTLTSGYTIKEFSSQKEGSCKVYITYGKKAAVFTVTIEKKAVEYKTGFYAVNSENGLHLRKEANAESDSLAVLPHTTRLEITQVKENWGKTTVDGVEGWVCLDYTKFLKETVVQTGLEATYQFPCILTGSQLDRECLSVFQIFSDGTKIRTTEYVISFGVIEETVLPITVTSGNFTAKTSVRILDAIPLGDTNFDGNVNATDALAVLKKAVGKSVTTFYEEVADLNGDKVTDSKDALLILRFAVGKIKEFPIETVTPTNG